VTLLSIVLSAALAAGVETSAAPVDARTPHVAIYLYPSSTPAMAFAGRLANVTMVYAATGMSLRLNEKLGLDIELAGGWLSRQLEYLTSNGWMFSLGIGPSFQLTGDERFRGLFIATRFRFEAFQPPKALFFTAPANEGPLDAGPGVARAFLGELDVGYHFRFGRFYFAPIIGFGVGYAYDYADATQVSTLSPFADPTTATKRPQGVVWTVNLNLARLGVAL
jgi:hypothetical protein